VSSYRRPVPTRSSREDDSATGLPRLPPGRHGLSRDFVIRNQRDRLAAGAIAAIAERGYHEASITEICAAAGVSRRTFYSYFASKEQCYLETFDLIGEHLREAMTEAGADVEDWPQKVQARLAAMLDVFAANPNLARFTLVAPLRAGEDIVTRYRLGLERLLKTLTEDRPAGDSVRDPSPAIEQALVGGMMALVTRRVEHGEEELPALLPDLVELFLTPYLGRQAAARAAAQSG
jgi:AcrR family transcriptional regulator